MPVIIELPAHPDDQTRFRRHRRGVTFLLLLAQPLLRHEESSAQLEKQRVLAEDGIAIFGLLAGRSHHQRQRVAVGFGRVPDRLSRGAPQALASFRPCFPSLSHSAPDTSGLSYPRPSSHM